MPMTKENIYHAISELAAVQGQYARLLKTIKEEPNYLTLLEQQHFNDVVDLILYLEG